MVISEARLQVNAEHKAEPLANQIENKQTELNDLALKMLQEKKRELMYTMETIGYCGKRYAVCLPDIQSLAHMMMQLFCRYEIPLWRSKAILCKGKVFDFAAQLNKFVSDDKLELGRYNCTYLISNPATVYSRLEECLLSSTVATEGQQRRLVPQQYDIRYLEDMLKQLNHDFESGGQPKAMDVGTYLQISSVVKKALDDITGGHVTLPPSAVASMQKDIADGHVTLPRGIRRSDTAIAETMVMNQLKDYLTKIDGCLALYKPVLMGRHHSHIDPLLLASKIQLEESHSIISDAKSDGTTIQLSFVDGSDINIDQGLLAARCPYADALVRFNNQCNSSAGYKNNNTVVLPQNIGVAVVFKNFLATGKIDTVRKLTAQQIIELYIFTAEYDSPALRACCLDSILKAIKLDLLTSDQLQQLVFVMHGEPLLSDAITPLVDIVTEPVESHASHGDEHYQSQTARHSRPPSDGMNDYSRTYTQQYKK